MKVTFTASELLDRGVWDEVCKLRGINEWAIKEGLMDGDEELTFSEEEAKKLGLLRK